VPLVSNAAGDIKTRGEEHTNCSNGRGQGRNVVQYANILIIVGLCRATRPSAAHILLFMIINMKNRTLRAPPPPPACRSFAVPVLKLYKTISLGKKVRKSVTAFLSSTKQLQMTLWHCGYLRPY
jgi:hypothetical protein